MVAALLDYWRAPRTGTTLPWMAPVPLPPLGDDPLVSVVAVSGRPALLRDLLDALPMQTWKRREVVVVGTDQDGAVAAVAAEAGARYVDAPGAGLGAARQAGVEAARGEVIAFTDDDCLPDARWLEALVDALASDQQLRGVQGRTEAEPGPVGSHAVQVTGPNSLFQTCNMAYRCRAIERAGGFDTRFLGWFEDTALAARVLRSGPIGFESRAVVRHRALPRSPRDRATWRRVLADERRLALHYRDFYRSTRGPGFLAGVVLHWLLGAPVKALLREAGGGLRDPFGYIRFALLLLGERIALIRALLEDVSRERREGAASATPSGDGSIQGQAR